MKTALVIGFGSIGQRHVRLLREMGLSVHVYSRRTLPEEKNFPNLKTALTEINPEYVVIANETSEHYSSLKTVLSFDVPHILVEKPLCLSLKQVDELNSASKLKKKNDFC